VYVPEDEVVGKTVLQNILVEDRDTVGDNLEVGCLPNEQVQELLLPLDSGSYRKPREFCWRNRLRFAGFDNFIMK
jgi:hypothetical protein